MFLISNSPFSSPAHKKVIGFCILQHCQHCLEVTGDFGGQLFWTNRKSCHL
jgi:hypothetical protein